jgi:hypothetical protein
MGLEPTTVVYDLPPPDAGVGGGRSGACATDAIGEGTGRPRAGYALAGGCPLIGAASHLGLQPAYHPGAVGSTSTSGPNAAAARST